MKALATLSLFLATVSALDANASERHYCIVRSALVAPPPQNPQPEVTKLMRVRYLTKVMVDLWGDGGVNVENRKHIAINLYMAGTGIGNIKGPSIESTIEAFELFRSAVAMHALLGGDHSRKGDQGGGLYHYADEAILLLLKQEYEAMDPSLRKVVFSDKLLKTVEEWFPGEFEIRDTMLWPPLGKSATTYQLYWPDMFTKEISQKHRDLFRSGTVPY